MFTNDYSWYEYVYLMRYKSETFEKFKEFKYEVEKQTRKPLKVLQSDWKGEYLSIEFQNHLKKNNIIS